MESRSTFLQLHDALAEPSEAGRGLVDVLHVDGVVVSGGEPRIGLGRRGERES
jgi:hypothetical protein